MENSIEAVDPENVLGMVSRVVRERVLQTYANNPEYQTLSEFELERVVQPSINARMIRGAFWKEYRRAKDAGQQMVMARVYHGIMEKQSFFEFIENPKQVAWMMSRPIDEFMQMDVDNYKVRKKFSELLDIPLLDAEGNLRSKEFNALVKIYQMYADRLHGSIIQRVEKKVQNIPADGISGSADEIKQKIKELEAIQIDVQKPDKS